MSLEVGEFNRWLTNREARSRLPDELQEPPPYLSPETERTLLEIELIETGYTKTELDQMTDYEVILRSQVLQISEVIKFQKRLPSTLRG